MDTTRHQGAFAIVTGAASGIGRATAARLAREGATVVATDVDGDGLASLAREHDAISAIPGDLTSATGPGRSPSPSGRCGPQA